MSDLSSLPHDVQQKLKTGPEAVKQNKLLPAEVAAVMYDHPKKCIWTKKSMHAELEDPPTPETVRKKLNDLVEIGLCKSEPANRGDIYWWDYPETDYPKPPDVEVEQSKLTVNELFQLNHIGLAVLSVVGITVGVIPLFMAIFGIAGVVPLPISPGTLLNYSLIYLLICYAVFIGAITAGVIDKFLPEDVSIDW